MRYIIFLSLLIVCNCAKSQIKEGIHGIWIPKAVNWKHGSSFKTYHIKDDTVVIISSFQKLIHDSIYFRAEPGFSVMKGVLKPVAEGKYLLPHRTLYRFIKISGRPDVGTDTISVVVSKGKTQKLNINGKDYIPGKLYTGESKQAIVFLATVTAPRMETHPEEFEE